MVWCHEDSWNLPSSPVPRGWQEIMCDQDHYISSISMKTDLSTRQSLITDRASTTLRYGSAPQTPLYDPWQNPDFSEDNYHLGSPYGFHVLCGNLGETKSVTDKNNANYLHILLPNDEVYWIHSFKLQKRGDGQNWSRHQLSEYKMDYLLDQDWVSGTWSPSNLGYNDGNDVIRTYSYSNLKARQLKIYIVGGYNTFALHGRFDLEVEKVWKPFQEVSIQCKSKNQNAENTKYSQQISYTGGQFSAHTSNEFVSGVQLIGSSDARDKGFYGLSVDSTPFSCKYEMTVLQSLTNYEIPAYEVDEGSSSSTYDQVTETFAFTRFFQNSNTYKCPIQSCILLENCLTQTIDPQNVFIDNGFNLVINKDPRAPFDYQICISCNNGYSTPFISSQFNVRVSCPNVLTINQPSDFIQTQTYSATTDVSQRAQFRFSPFQTTMAACLVQVYRIFESESNQVIPNGIQITNPLTQSNDGFFYIPVSDSVDLRTYSMVIQATWGASTIYSPISLIVQCPSSVSFNIPSYSTSRTSYVGANLVGTGQEASYTFFETSSQLPSCNTVTGYEIVDQSPTGKITYPSSKFCSGNSICLTLDFDVQQQQVIQFRVKPIDTLGQATAGPLITITVGTNPSPVSITNSQFGTSTQAASTQQILLDSTQKFNFDPFFCSSGCSVSYQISSTTGTLSSLGLTPIFNPSTSKYELEFGSSSILSHYFYIYASLTDLPSTFLWSEQLTARIVCGSEIVTPIASQVSLPVQVPSKQVQSIIIDANQYFTSSKAGRCDIQTVQVQGEVFVSNNVGHNVLQFQENAGVKRMITMRAESQGGVSANIKMWLIVCGQESVYQVVTNTVLIGERNQVFEINKAQFFFLSSGSNSHDDCLLNPTLSLLSSDCLSPSSLSFQTSLDKLIISTSSPLPLTQFCLKIETLGKVSATQILSIQINGGEKMLINQNGQIKKVLARGQLQVIDIWREGYVFQSDNQYAPVVGYTLFQNTVPQKVYIQGRTIVVDTSSPLKVQMSVGAYSASSTLTDYLQIEIQVCGNEKVQLNRQSLEKEYAITGPSTMITQRELMTMFKVNDTECPIKTLQLFQGGKVYNQNWLYMTENQIFINPKKKTGEETINLVIKASTLGNTVIDLPFIILFGSSLQLKGISGPYFQIAPKIYTLSTQIDSSKEQLVEHQSTSLPLIVDNYGISIKPIENIVAFRGESAVDLQPISTPSWLLFFCQRSCNLQSFRIENDQSVQTSVKVKDSGFYKFEFKIQNSAGDYTNEHIFLQLIVNDMNIKQLYEFAKNGLDSDIFFTILVSAQCGDYFIQIDKFEFFCQFGVGSSQEGFQYCHDVFLYCFEIYVPRSANELLSGEGQEYTIIETVTIKFVVQQWMAAHQLWKETSQKEIAQEELIGIMQTTLNYRVEGITMGNEQCKFQKILADTDDVQTNQVSEIAYSNFVKSPLWNKTLSKVVSQAEQVQTKVEQSTVRQVKLIQNDFDVYLRVEFTKPLFIIEDQSKFFNFIKVFSQSAEDDSIQQGSYNISSRELQDEETDLAEQNLKFNYSVSQDATGLKINLLFLNPKAVSQSIYGRDQMYVVFHENDVLRDIKSNQTLLKNSFNKKYIVTLAQQKVVDANILVSQKAVNGFQITILALQANVFVLNILLSKSMQDIFGLLNTHQILTHMMLLTCSVTAPSNIYVYNGYISQFAQKDLYPTDEIYGVMFNFTDSESPIEQFEDLGYEGANFLSLTGSVIINLILTTLVGFYQMLNLYCSKKFYKYEFMRNRGISIQRTSNMKVILSIYLQGYLELFICAVISLREVFKQDLLQNASDVFAFGFAIFSSIVLVALPIAIFYQVYRRIQSPEQFNYEKYDFIFSELKIETFLASAYNLIFIMRRIIFACLLIFMHDHLGLQLMSHIVCTLFYAAYIIQYKPFVYMSQNGTQILNEVSVILCSYVLILICNDNIDIDLKYKLGYVYIVFNSMIFVFNMYLTLEKVIFVIIPQYFKHRKEKKERESQAQFLKNWMKKQENGTEEVKHLIQIKCMNIELNQLQAKYDRQLQWLRNNGLSVNVMFKQKQEILNKRKSLKKALMKNDKKEKQIIKIKANDESLQALKQSLKQVKGISNPFNQLNSRNFDQYLNQVGCKILEFKPDGNWAPKAIAARIYGDKNKHNQVRQEVRQYLLTHHQFWGNMRQMEDYHSYLQNTFKVRGEPFTYVEVCAAAKLYSIPIVYRQWSFGAFTQEDNEQEPLHMHERGMLVYKSQKLKINGLKKFKITSREPESQQKFQLRRSQCLQEFQFEKLQKRPQEILEIENYEQ